MLIALLALLGVNLAALLALAAFVLTRKRWVKRQPGAFRGAFASPTERSTVFTRNGAAATDAGSATSSSGRRGRSCSATTSLSPTTCRSIAPPFPARSSASATNPP